MSATGSMTMEKMLSRCHSFRTIRDHVLRSAAMSLLLAMIVSGTAWAQSVVTGTVTQAGGGPLPGVTVRIPGTESGSLTNATGRYTITAPANGALAYTLIGQKPAREEIGGRTRIDVSDGRRDLPRRGGGHRVHRAASRRHHGRGRLDQRRERGPPDGRQRSPEARRGAGHHGRRERLARRSRSTVRIRGISSFQNNDPLYVIDGMPVQDSYINWLNPNDITSIQVLKDASAASIYGSRASNGVIVIETTKRGASGPPRVTLSARTGLATPDARLRRLPDPRTRSTTSRSSRRATRTPAAADVPTNIYGDPNNPTVPAYTFCAPSTCTTDAFGRAGQRGRDQVLVSELPDHARQPGHELVGGGVRRPGAGRGLQPERRRRRARITRTACRSTTSTRRARRRTTASVAAALRVNTSVHPRQVHLRRERRDLGRAQLRRHRGDPGGYAEDGIIGKNILIAAGRPDLRHQRQLRVGQGGRPGQQHATR